MFYSKIFVAQLNYENNIRFGEVYYYFRLTINGVDKTLAMTSLYTLHDAILAERSTGALIVCGYQGNAGLVVIDAKKIVSVVAMIPFIQDDREDVELEQFFVVEKPGLDFAEVSENEDA